MTERPSDRLRDAYERRAARSYARPPGRPDLALDRKFERVTALLHEHLLPCESFLDAGCGDGRHLVAVGTAAQRLAGVDISERILETARSALAPQALEVELRRANLEGLPFEDGRFDAVLCTQVIEHLLDPHRGVAELARVLRPAGRLLLTTDNRRAASAVVNAPRAALAWLLRGGRPHFEFPHRSFPAGEVRALVERAGLELEHVETFRFHLDPPFDARRLPALQKALNALDRSLPAHPLGDIVAVVARRPGR